MAARRPSSYARRLVPVLVALLGAAPAAASPSAAVHPPGTVVADVDAALRPPYRPLNALTLDMDGDDVAEQAVLYGRTDARGVARVAGLLLLSRDGRRWRVEGAVPVGGSRFVSASFAAADVAADLDGDGAREVVVTERLAEPDVHREVRTWWRWDRSRRRVTRLHEAEVGYGDAGVPGGRPAVEERRTVRSAPPDDAAPRLVETVERREGTPPARSTRRIVYRLDEATGRFVPLDRRGAAGAPHAD